MARFRKLSAVEYSFLARDTGEESPYVNQFFVEGKGKITLEQMQAAVRKAAEANPGITLLLKGKWAWRYWENDTRDPLVREYKGDWQGNNSLNTDVIDEPLNPYEDVLSSITLFTNIRKESVTDEKAVDFKILFRIHHALCDGMGTLHWMEEVFRALRGEPLLGSKSDIFERDIVKREDYPKAENILTDSRPVFPASNHPHTRSCHWIKYRWQGKDSKIVGRLIYILREMAEENHGPCKTTFRIASNLRRYLTDEEKDTAQLTNLSSVFDLSFENKTDVNKIQSQIVSALRAKKDLSLYPKKLLGLVPFLPDSVYHPKASYLESIHEQGICNITASISYPGRIKLEQFSCEGFEALGIYGIPIPLEDKSVFIGFFTDKYGMLAVLSVPNALSDIEGTTKLAKKIGNALKEI